MANQEEMHVQEEEFVEYDPEVQIYPGGPTQGEVETWKIRFGEVFATEFDETIFVWRTLSRTEYKEVLSIKNADPMYREERICEKCVLWPKGYDHIAMARGKAGIPSLLAEQIMDKSGFLPNGEAKKL